MADGKSKDSYLPTVKSNTTLNKKFIKVLSDVGIDLDKYPDKTFDCLFDNAPDDAMEFLNWFCENISADNVLSEEERVAYDELERSGLLVPQESLDYLISKCDPPYEDVRNLKEDFVNYTLSEELKQLEVECEKLSNTYSSLEILHADLKNMQETKKDELHVLKSKLSNAEKDCENVNLSISSAIEEFSNLVNNVPSFNIDVNPYVDTTKLEDRVYSILKTHHCQLQDLSGQRNSYYFNLGKDMTAIQLQKIIFEGKVQEKKTVNTMLEKIINADPSERKSIICELELNQSVTNVPNVIEDLEKKICEIESDALPIEIGKLSELALSHILANVQMDKFYSIKNQVNKLSIYKNYLIKDKIWDDLLNHVITEGVDNIKQRSKVMDECYTKLNKDAITMSDQTDKLEWRIRKFKETVAQSNVKHPFLLAWKKFVDAHDDIAFQDQFPSIVNVMRKLIDNPSSNLNHFCRDLEQTRMSVLPLLLCGPTSQLLFTPIHIKLRFQDWQDKNQKFCQELKKLANIYVDFKTAIAKGSRQRDLLWMLFLTKPTELENLLQQMQREAIKRQA